LHYLAIGEKNKIFLLLVVQAVSDFARQKNSRISHQTCKFVQRVEGQGFLKREKVHIQKALLVLITLLAQNEFYCLKAVFCPGVKVNKRTNSER